MKRLPWIFLFPLLVGCSGNHSGILEVAGRIEAVSVDVGSKIGGRVANVFFEEGDPVHAGDILVKLESEELEAMVQAAIAKLAQAEAQYQKAEHGARPEEIEQAEAELRRLDEQYQMAVRGARVQEENAARAAVRAAEAQWEAASRDFHRAERLVDKALARRDYDMAKARYEAAEAQLRTAREQLSMVLEGPRSEEVAMAKAARDQAEAAVRALKTGVREEDKATARALRDEAASALRLAENNLRETEIRAPMDGVIESLDLHPGDLVRPGAVARVVRPDDLELRVYVSAFALGHIRLGDTVAVEADSYPGTLFQGTVTYIASEGEYTPRNLQTREERVHQMFAVKIKLNSSGGKLRSGMTATARFPIPRKETP